MPYRNNWRWCRKCKTLSQAFDNASSCYITTDGNQKHDHVTIPSFDYFLMHDEPGATGQDQWRLCINCKGLCFADLIAPGPCFAGGPGSTHIPLPFFNYILRHDEPGTTGQDQWRFCNKCKLLAYAGEPSPGPCYVPPGSIHDHTGTFNYNLEHDLKRKAVLEIDLTVGVQVQEFPIQIGDRDLRSVFSDTGIKIEVLFDQQGIQLNNNRIPRGDLPQFGANHKNATLMQSARDTNKMYAYVMGVSGRLEDEITPTGIHSNEGIGGTTFTPRNIPNSPMKVGSFIFYDAGEMQTNGFVSLRDRIGTVDFLNIVCHELGHQFKLEHTDFGVIIDRDGNHEASIMKDQVYFGDKPIVKSGDLERSHLATHSLEEVDPLGYARCLDPEHNHEN